MFEKNLQDWKTEFERILVANQEGKVDILEDSTKLLPSFLKEKHLNNFSYRTL